MIPGNSRATKVAKFKVGDQVKVTNRVHRTSFIGRFLGKLGVVKSVKQSKLMLGHPFYYEVLWDGSQSAVQIEEKYLESDTSLPTPSVEAKKPSIVISRFVPCPLCGQSGEVWVNKVLCSNSACRNHRK